MSHHQVRKGAVKKIVRISHPPSSGDQPSHPQDYVGYGILQDDNGQDVFFVGSAVSDGEFDKLETGTQVIYTLEPGPLAQASQVRVSGESPARENSSADVGNPIHHGRPAGK